MANPTGGYSRTVQILKIVLPLSALAVLSTLFLISERVDIDGAAARIGISELLTEQGMSAPNYVTTTADGSILSLKGARAKPIEGEAGTFEISKVELRLVQPAGGAIELVADKANIPANRNLASFFGNVALQTNNGIKVTTTSLDAATDLSLIRISDPLEALTPFGSLSAGMLEIRSYEAGEKKGSYIAHFQNGVKLIYSPQKR